MHTVWTSWFYNWWEESEKKGRNVYWATAVRRACVLSCVSLCDSLDCGLPGSSACRIYQARILEWVAIPLSRVSSWPWDWTQVSCIAGVFFTMWATREIPKYDNKHYMELYKTQRQNFLHAIDSLCLTYLISELFMWTNWHFSCNISKT